MPIKYQPKKIEKKWQKIWEEKKVFAAKVNPRQRKFYALIEFPYPSGEGLHTGHLRSNTAMDIIARQRRLAGYEVLYPIGFDSFGLPAENYAVKKGIAPQLTTKANIKNFTRQLKSSGFSFDWSRSFSTTDEDYYQWTQWIFIQLFKQGLAYKAKENINWCTSCKIGLANEEVVNGVCERCGGQVIKKEKEQWMLKITKYADRLISGLDKVDFLSQIKQQQVNWIGRSEGALIKFSLQNIDGQADNKHQVEVFTSRPDTLFGATFLVISPELAQQWIALGWQANKQVLAYLEKARKKSDLERQDIAKEKTGVDTEIKAINPANGESIPVWLADYVLGSYGTGAIMAVPAHDERDFAFAQKYQLPVKCVISPVDKVSNELLKLVGVNPNENPQQILDDIHAGQRVYIADGSLINSGKYNGLASTEAAIKITKEFGSKKVNYKLRDWIFSRQRYWGEPIPMVHCSACGWQPVPEKELPVKLPKVKDFLPTENGDSPLAKVENWIKTKCPQCNKPARRETDVMPNWAGSNWYFIRYTDPKNNQALASAENMKYWLPVDWYNGGMEHTTLHLLYSRFIFKFLYDIKVIPKEVGDEPYAKRTAHGLILGEGGVKMSKSKGNVINPDDYVNKYGADTLRVYEMFMGPFDQAIPWDDKGVIGVYRFLNKVWELQFKVVKENKSEDNSELTSLLHQTIKKVTDDIEQMKFNTAISQLMILANYLDRLPKVSQEIWSKFVLMLSVFAPHLAEELYEQAGNKQSLAKATWPEYDKRLAQAQTVVLAIQINGKVREEINLPHDAEDSESIRQQVLSLPRVQSFIKDQAIKKYIHIKNKIISIVI